MAIKVRKGGAWQTVSAIKVYANGAWRTVGNFTAPAEPPPTGGGGGTGGGGTGGGGGGGTLTVSISPSSFAASSSLSPVSILLTATPSGGLAPYEYDWSDVSSSAVVTFTAPAAATTAAKVALSAGTDADGTLRCTVTDSLGTVGHADVPGSWTRTA